MPHIVYVVAMYFSPSGLIMLYLFQAPLEAHESLVNLLMSMKVPDYHEDLAIHLKKKQYRKDYRSMANLRKQYFLA